ncbi:acyl-homoserine-lactone synthase [Pseudomonas simiae]|uniref:acyl-homoserine-lactone synthase n=1 Tax=Pseudomonas simiae TaxID=321846 RepID=UPI0012539467|nr:acyl-homoserine-lactone synthase [Pseudomonas simiae]WLH17677.1 acyl-homoserine-lactone synthase [Pseudomonas simiae]VVO11640.1 Acyl-homoserine-lactone synthase [Pseudomonas fluorescens]
MFISIDRRENFEAQHLQKMHTLRAKIFKNKKEWDVNIIAGMEIDGYDALNPYYMIITSSTAEPHVSGCWRILPTTGPNMLAHTFPVLLHGDEAPCSEHIWELSRFAIEAPKKSTFNFSDISTTAIRALVEFAMARNISQLVTVTTVGVEKMLIRLGLDLSRFGPSMKIGVEQAVALKVELNEHTWRALSSTQ